MEKITIPTPASLVLMSSVADADAVEELGEAELPEKSGFVLASGLVNALVEEESLSLV